jgi:hypothetical protein
MRIALALFSFLLLASCSEESRLERQKSAYFHKFNALVERVEKNNTEFSADEWEEADEELDRLTGIEKNELQAVLTGEDRQFIKSLENRYEAAYAAGLGKRLFKGLKRKIHEATKE